MSSDPSAHDVGTPSDRNQKRRSKRLQLDSDEELVSFAGDRGTTRRDDGTMKMTNISVTDTGASDCDIEQVHVQLKSWERQTC